MTRMSLPIPTLHTARLRLRPFGDAVAGSHQTGPPPAPSRQDDHCWDTLPHPA
jgi:hypothetical protein